MCIVERVCILYVSMFVLLFLSSYINSVLRSTPKDESTLRYEHKHTHRV